MSKLLFFITVFALAIRLLVGFVELPESTTHVYDGLWADVYEQHSRDGWIDPIGLFVNIAAVGLSLIGMLSDGFFTRITGFTLSVVQLILFFNAGLFQFVPVYVWVSLHSSIGLAGSA